MDVFNIDAPIASLIRDMSQDELAGFSARHDKPVKDEDIEISTYAFLLMYTKFGSVDHRDKAFQLATKWLNNTSKCNPDWNRRCKLLEVIRSSVVEGSKDVGLEAISWAKKLLAAHETSRERDPEKLDLAIQYALTSVAYTPMGHIEQASRLLFLAELHVMKYKMSTELRYLSQAIWYLEMAANSPTRDDTEALVCVEALSTHLAERHMRQPGLDDLNRLIELGEQVVVMSKKRPCSELTRSIHLVNLATWLGRRFEQVGSATDVDRAVEMAEAARDLTPPGSGNRAHVLGVLGSCLMLRSTRGGRIADLDAAVELSKEAITLTDVNDPGRCMLLASLGSCYLRRHQIQESEADVIRAIESIEEAKDRAVKGAVDRLIWLDSLSQCYHQRWKMHKHKTAVLNKSIELSEEAFATFPPSHPKRVSVIFNLGSHLLDRFFISHEEKDASRSVAVLREGWESRQATAVARIQCAEQAGKALAAQEKWAEAKDLLQRAVLELSESSPRSLRPDNKQHALAKAAGLGSSAAAVSLQAGAEAGDALVLLEAGRGVISRSIMDLRVNLTELEQRHPDLAKEYTALRRKIEVPGIFKNISFTNLNPKETSELFFKEAREAENKLRELLVRIQACDGFQNFLLPPSKADMAHTGDLGPVVTINVSAYRCDAFVISDGRIWVLELPRLSLDVLKAQFDNPERAQENRSPCGVLDLRATMEWLWDVAVGPILDSLGFREPASLDNLPHIWWIPTGLLSRLPIHAAGYHEVGSKATVLDRVMSSYATSVRSLVPTRINNAANNRCGAGSDDVARPGRAVLVSMHQTPGVRSLPFALQEIDIVQELLRAMKLDVTRPPTRKYRITKALETCTVFHFAGHGQVNPFNPARSALLLEDWETDPLTVDDLRDIWIESPGFSLNWDDDFLTGTTDQDDSRSASDMPPFLAYLSACSSAVGSSDELSDESIYLASALQLAGFRHVIATLWDVLDQNCVEVARAVYETLVNHGLRDRSVCLALHRAVKALRDKRMLVSAGLGNTENPGATGCGRASAVEQEAHDHEETPKLASEPGTVDKGGSRPRDAIPVDGGKKLLKDMDFVWAPFVHFGV
ncbi:hypothetical protein ACJ41O_014401 [Fusarium nematophilum]